MSVIMDFPVLDAVCTIQVQTCIFGETEINRYLVSNHMEDQHHSCHFKVKVVHNFLSQL